LTADALCNVLASFGYELSALDCAELVAREAGFADPLFRYLGSEAIRSFDASDYEGATDVFDFNNELPSDVYQSFDLVLDGGSLEHIFDVATALRTCMEMVSLEGHFVALAPANNFFGHGFYQFSPEFYYRSLAPENGFQIRRLSVFEGRADPLWYDVCDPRDIGLRANAMTRRPTTIAVLAQRVSAEPLFRNPPEQSDYVRAWMHDRPNDSRARPKPPGLLARLGPRGPHRLLKTYRRLRALLSRRRYDARMFRRRPVPPAK
jgi:hypothetical protein